MSFLEGHFNNLDEYLSQTLIKVGFIKSQNYTKFPI